VPGRRRDRMVTCPLLEAGADHVAFNGNGTCWGTGYRHQILMPRMGCRPVKDGRLRVRLLRAFLRTLGRLQAVTGGVAAGFLDGDWYGPTQMLEMTRTKQGLRRLRRACLRFYARADYLQRWRGLLAPALGKADLAAGGGEAEQAHGAGLWARLERAGV